MKKNILYFAFAFSLFATVGSLFISELLHWTPCPLCWYQRIMLFPLVIIFAVGIIKEVTNLEYIVWPMVFIGGLVGAYHNLLQYNIISEELAPCVTGVSCIASYHIGFHFITVPLLSLVTFIIIAILMYAYRKAKA